MSTNINNLSNKTIKHIYLKKDLINRISQKSLKHKTFSLCFLNQGLNSKDFKNLRTFMSNWDLNIKQIPRSSWSKSICLYNEHNNVCSNLKKKTFIKNNVFGNVILISSSLKNIEHKNMNFMISFYKEIVNFLIDKKKEQNTQLNKSITESILNSKNIQNNNLFSSIIEETYKKTQLKCFNKNTQIVLPWEILSTKTIQLDSVLNKNKTTKNKELLIQQEPLKILKQSLYDNHLTFSGVIKNNSSLEYFNPDLYIDYSLVKKSKNKNQLTPYDIILQNSMNSLDGVKIFIEGINQKVLLYL